MNSYKPEVHTSSCQPGAWTGNLVRFPLTPAGKRAAEDYVQGLMDRWTAVTETHVVESSDQPNREVTG